MAEPWDTTIGEAARLLRARALSPGEPVRSLLQRIEATEPRVHAYARVTGEEAIEAARAAEREITGGGWKGPLHGIPVALKDLFLPPAVPTEAGSRVMRGFVPTRNSAVADRLQQSGAIVIGKTVTHEFAYGQNT